MMRTLNKAMSFLLMVFLLGSNSLASQESTVNNSSEGIKMDSQFSYTMLESNQNLRKVDLLLEARKRYMLPKKTLIIGTSLLAIIDYQKSNRDSKFAYLMRHPTANNQIGKEVSEAAIHSFQLMFTGAINNWIAAHTEILYNPEQSFGPGTITSLGRNQLQLRKAFILVGDLNKFPVYFALGKMDTPFGQTGSVSPFTNSTMWHAFGGLGFGAQVGYKKYGLHLTAMAVQGGAQFRALHTPVGESSNVPSKLNNYTFDGNYTMHLKEDLELTLGASYLYGSAYCQNFPVTHFESCDDHNPAYSVYGRFNLSDRFLLKGSFAQTTKEWSGTHNPNPPLNIFEASKVSSLDIGAQYQFNTTKHISYAVSGEFSNFKAGPEGAPWERQNQWIAGITGIINKSSRVFVELFRTDGYAPLNFISGSAPDNPFPVGETHSERGASSHGIIVGGLITI